MRLPQLKVLEKQKLFDLTFAPLYCQVSYHTQRPTTELFHTGSMTYTPSKQYEWVSPNIDDHIIFIIIIFIILMNEKVVLFQCKLKTKLLKNRLSQVSPCMHITFCTIVTFLYLWMLTSYVTGGCCHISVVSECYGSPLKALIEYLSLMFEKILCCYFMVDSTGLIMLAIWPVCELPVWKLNIESHILTQATVWGKFFCFTFSIFVLFQNLCYVILFSRLNWLSLVALSANNFSSKLLTKSIHFWKQAFRRICIWNCELIISLQDVKKIYIRKREKGPKIALHLYRGRGELVFRDGYHAWVWPLKFKMDPKLGFWVDSKSHSKQGFWQIFNTIGLKLGFFEFGKIPYPNQRYGLKIMP